MNADNLLKLFENQEVNVKDEERMLSAAVGGLLVAQSLFTNRNPLKIAAGGYLLYRGLTGHCPLYTAVNDLRISEPQNITIKTALTVNKPVAEVYAFWRRLENLPFFMSHLERVEIISNSTSKWKANIPGGLGTIDWDATIVLDEPNVRLGWKSNEDATILNAGTIHFKDAGKLGTELLVHLSYHAPAGKIGEGVARLFNPIFERMVTEDIRNFTRYIETGDIPSIEGQPSAH